MAEIGVVSDAVSLIDSCVVIGKADDGVGLIWELYEGVSDTVIPHLDASELALENVSSIPNTRIIDEVRAELMYGLEALNGQISFNEWRLNFGGGKHICRRKTLTRSDSNDGQDYSREILERIRKYADRHYRFIRKLAHFGDPRESFTDHQNNLYEFALNRTEALFPRTSAPEKVGDFLNTDNKLIATAFALNVAGPVRLYTADRPLRKRFSRVGEEVTKEYKIKDGPEVILVDRNLARLLDVAPVQSYAFSLVRK